MDRETLIARLRSQAAHDGKTFPSGGEPPTAHMRTLLMDAAAALAAETARADREAAARQEAERISAGRLDQLLRKADESIQAWIRAENAEAERDRLRAELAALRGFTPRTPGTGRQALIEQEHQK